MSESRGTDVSIVIATKDRSGPLERCLRALLSDPATGDVEVLVVDDGSASPVADLLDASLSSKIRVIRTDGCGPAVARNIGWQASRGEIVLFTDDDTVPARGWVEAAQRFLGEHPGHVGVEGPVVTAAFDPLYEHSVDSPEPGSFVTCNIAYRRTALVRVGGLSDAFPYAYCEDLDLGLRMLEVGPIGFAREMRVEHEPRRLTLRELIARGLLASSELVLFVRHESFPRERAVPLVLSPGAGHARAWLRLLRAEGFRLVLDPRRLARFVAAALGEVACTVLASVAAYPNVRRRAPELRADAEVRA